MILSLDASTKKTGWALYNKEKLVEHGIIYLEGEDSKTRIYALYHKIKEYISLYKVEGIVLEDVPITSHNNLSTGKTLAVLQGMITSLCFEFDLGLILYNPSAWRTLIPDLYSGTREGMKRDYQKQRAVEITNNIYGLDLMYYKSDTKANKSQDDEAEAILLGLAYINDIRKRGGQNERI
jgi:Holliday junction resolvasome RuvABC endonuclease subunit